MVPGCGPPVRSINSLCYVAPEKPGRLRTKGGLNEHLERHESGTDPVPEIPLSDSVTLSEAVSIYLKQNPVTFHRAAGRSCGYVIDVAGDKDLRAYGRRRSVGNCRP